MSFRKLAGLAGLVFVVLVVANVILLGDQPGLNDSVREIRDYLGKDEGLHDAATIVGFVLLFPAIVFFAGLFGKLRASDHDHDEHWGVALVIAATVLATIATAGGVAFATLALRGAGTLDPAVLRVFWDLQYLMFIATSIGVAVVAVSVAVPVLRHRIWPAWYGWITLLVAALGFASLGGTVTSDNDVLGFLAFPALVIWVLVTSIVMLRDAGTSAPSAAV